MTTFKVQPDAQGVDPTTHRNMQRIYSAHQTLDGTVIKAPVRGAGFAVAAGTETVLGSRTGIATGLDKVLQVVASIDAGATATNQWVSARVTPTNVRTIDVFVWQPTASGDNTPIASGTPTVVHWWCTGTSTRS